MTFSDQFSVLGDAIAPQPWMQFRLVETAEVASVSKSYDPSDGWAKADLLQTLQTSWANDSPVDQWVYGLVSKSGSQVTLQCRSRGYLSTRHGFQMGSATGIPMIEVSRFGIGTDLGNGGLLSLGGAYGISEIRQNSTTATFMPHLTGWFPVAPGQTIHARVEVYFASEFWENTQIDGGDNDTESKVIAGDLRLDLFAVPAMKPPPPVTTPTLVGGVSNIRYDVERDLGIADQETSVILPSGLLEGDVLVAVVVNNFGIASAIQPVESGWTLLHSRNEGLSGLNDVHMKIYVRTVTGAEPSTYKFTNGLLAEETAVLFALRGAAPYEPGIGNWLAASNLSRYRLWEKHVCPSIERKGQLLIGISLVSKLGVSKPITHAAPAGMTEVLDLSNTASAVGIAMLSNPPTPTGERTFHITNPPVFNGHSICASILVPGAQSV